MKKFLLGASALSALIATPALAQNATMTGGRVEALVGYDTISVEGFDESGVLYGIGAGYDFAIGTGAALGFDVEVSDSTTDIGDVSTGRDLYAGARASFAVGQNANLYIKAGYTNARIKVDGFGGENGDGFRLGAGGEVGIGGKAFVGGEYRYSNYELDFSRHQFAVKVGTRF